MLRKHRVWLSLHFTHPNELTAEVGEACDRLADAAITLGCQTVLLKGINDDLDTMKRMMHGLTKPRVQPHYITQCEPLPRSPHFSTSLVKVLDNMSSSTRHAPIPPASSTYDQ